MDIRIAVIEKLSKMDLADEDSLILTAEKLIEMIRQDMKEDLMVDLGEMEITETAMDAYELIESNY